MTLSRCHVLPPAAVIWRRSVASALGPSACKPLGKLHSRLTPHRKGLGIPNEDQLQWASLKRVRVCSGEELKARGEKGA
jgi:hypothetical protein